MTTKRSKPKKPSKKNAAGAARAVKVPIAERPLLTPPPADQWRPAKNRSHLRNRPRLRERLAASVLLDQIATQKRAYADTFGTLAPPVARIVANLEEAVHYERERVRAITWLAYLEDRAQYAWNKAERDVRQLVAVYELVEKVKGKLYRFEAVKHFKSARSAAAQRAAATKRSKRAARTA